MQRCFALRVNSIQPVLETWQWIIQMHNILRILHLVRNGKFRTIDPSHYKAEGKSSACLDKYSFYTFNNKKRRPTQPLHKIIIYINFVGA